MKRIMSNLVAFVIDLAMAGLLSVVNVLFLKEALCIGAHWGLILALSFVLYYTFVLLTHQTIGQSILASKKQKNRVLRKKKFWANILDCSVICLFSLVLLYLTDLFYPFRYYLLVLIASIAYYTFAYLLFDKTLGQSLFGISLRSSNKVSAKIIIPIRETCFKWGPFMTIIIILFLLRYTNDLFNVTYALLLFLFFKFYHHQTTGMNWWDRWAKTEHVIEKDVLPKSKLICFEMLGMYVLSFGLLMCVQNRNPHPTGKFLGFNLYDYNPYYPVNKSVKKKRDFVLKQPNSAKEYIFKLFEDFDIVILGERTHTEMKQWDFIYDIVSDPRFASNVGHLFTEYGSSDQQQLIDDYLETKFENDTAFNKATTNLLREFGQWPIWYNRNIFDFFKKLNNLEQTLPDSLKIKEYFCDVNTFSPSIQTPQQWQIVHNIHRDSALADIVIKNYKSIRESESRKKCLVIANYRHSWNDLNYFKNKKNYEYFPNEASYIFNAFPGKVANVLINCSAFGKTGITFLNENIRKGEWDKTFELCGNRSVGFDFKDSPFGKDNFDLMFPFGKDKKICFQDIYTGFVFITPQYEMKYKEGVPYTMDGFEKEYQRRLYLMGADTNNMKQIIENQRMFSETWDEEIIPPRISGVFRFSLIYNNFAVIAYLIMMLLGISIIAFEWVRNCLKA